MSSKFKIAAFILCHNEKEILPHVIKHYKQFCKDIFILNNEDKRPIDYIEKNDFDKSCAIFFFPLACKDILPK